ncbi:SDR family oxidoreductase [Spirillospora sp. NBC_01491]|uniref:SDR family oxidoreductase n=1 Tax=Spirillospora sp. NBC_01491 TaxID=2976007 RepID=UPI003247817E
MFGVGESGALHALACSTSTAALAITGATGNVGGQLAALLAVAGEQVTALSRRALELPDGVRYVRADLGAPAGLKSAFNGANALFLLVAGDDPEAVLDAARSGGARQVVLLSSQGAGTRSDTYRYLVVFEEAVRRSDLEWTILRPRGFHSTAYA